MEPCDGLINSVHAGVVINGQRLVVGEAAEGWLRIVHAGSKRRTKVEDILIEERHLDGGIGVIEIDGGLQRSAGHWYSDTRREVRPHVSAEVEGEDEELAISRWKGEPCGIEINYSGACRGERFHSFLKRVEHRLRCWHIRIKTVEPGTSQTKSRPFEPFRIQKHGVIRGNIDRPGLACSLPA